MANPAEIMDALESLATHCRAPLMSIDDRSKWMRDWCEDLKAFEIGDIVAACRNWRQSENLKFPTPGQLLPLVRSARGRTAKSPETVGAWSWPSDAELDAMTLSGRRRQYLIMATEARGRAGPMDSSGQHPRPEWIEKAKAYLEEAQRLAAHIARGAQKRTGAA